MAVKKKKKDKKEFPAPAYMLTYGDMVTLLLTFFVMMFTMGEAEPKEMRLILSAFSGSLGMYKGGKTLSKGPLAEMGQTIEALPSREKGSALARSKKEAKEILKPELRAKTVRITEDERGLRISLGADMFFQPGSAELNLERASPVLKRIAQIITRVENRIRIEGHTDNQPTDPEGKYPTNWELSSARAISVLKFMLGQGAKENKFEVSGFSKYRPLDPTPTPEGRAYNRRVDIIILRD